MEGAKIRQRTDLEGGVLEGRLLRKAVAPSPDVSTGTTCRPSTSW
jgi:hypothetical protein